MKDMVWRTFRVLVFVTLLAFVIGVMLFAFGWRPNVGIFS